MSYPIKDALRQLAEDYAAGRVAEVEVPPSDQLRPMNEWGHYAMAHLGAAYRDELDQEDT